MKFIKLLLLNIKLSCTKHSFDTGFEVEYALRGVKSPVGVSEFRLSKSLPKELLDKLANPKELEEELMREITEEPALS